MRYYRLWPLIVMAVLCCLEGCGSKSTDTFNYQQHVEEQLASGARSDSLFMGYYFGMERQAFYDHSWKLNNQKKIYQGDRGRSVRLEIDSLSHAAHVNFYPLFVDDRIVAMPVYYQYTGWAPWNRELWADSLESELVAKFERRYDASFHQVTHPREQVPAHVYLQNNLQIFIYEENDREVVVEYSDLSALPQTATKR